MKLLWEIKPPEYVQLQLPITVIYFWRYPQIITKLTNYLYLTPLLTFHWIALQGHSSIHPSVRPSIDPSIHLSIHLSICDLCVPILLIGGSKRLFGRQKLNKFPIWIPQIVLCITIVFRFDHRWSRHAPPSQIWMVLDSYTCEMIEMNKRRTNEVIK